MKFLLEYRHGAADVGFDENPQDENSATCNRSALSIQSNQTVDAEKVPSAFSQENVRKELSDSPPKCRKVLDVNARDFENDDTAAHVAIHEEQTCIFKLLLDDKRVDMNLQNARGDSAFDLVSKPDTFEKFRWLLQIHVESS